MSSILLSREDIAATHLARLGRASPVIAFTKSAFLLRQDVRLSAHRPTGGHSARPPARWRGGLAPFLPLLGIVTTTGVMLMQVLWP